MNIVEGKIRIPATIDGIVRYAWVSVRMNKRTARIDYSTDGIDTNPAWFFEFRKAFDGDGRHTSGLDHWVADNASAIKGATGRFSAYGGAINKIPHEIADELFTLAKSEIYRSIRTASKNYSLLGRN